MNWSYRKSFGTSAFRINFSKKGISYSMGMKGARINIGPQGTYVNLSSHGISYRRKIAGSSTTPSSPTITPPATNTLVHNIGSADIEQLTDTDSKTFIAELSQKSSKIPYTNWLGILPFLIFLVILLSTAISTRYIVIQPAKDSSFVKVTTLDVRVRKEANSSAPILTTASYEQTFVLLDSTRQKWFQVEYNGSIGYINRQFAVIDHLHQDPITEPQSYLRNPYIGYELIGGIAFFIWLIIRLKRLDKKRFTMELYYDMDVQYQQVYQHFSDHFAHFSGSARIWQYLNAQSTNDYKRNAGAGKLIKRTPIRGISKNKAPLRHFLTNITIPYLALNNMELYFLPERLLIRRGNSFAAVFYKHLRITGRVTRFIEEESVPGDAQILDYTWRYLNKNGGPDRRFNDNRKIPICAYSEYTLTSDTGFYEVITTSRSNAMDAFAGFLSQIGHLQSAMAII